jgi:hypothetical protein
MTVLYLRDVLVTGIRYELSETQGTGATLGSGNEGGSTFVEKLRFEREVGTSINGTSFSCSIDMASVSASTLEWRWRVVKVDSSGTIVTGSAYSTAHNTAGIKTQTLTLSTTWAAGDRVGISLELRKTGGGGNRSFTLNVNDVDSKVDAPIAAVAREGSGSASSGPVAASGTVAVVTGGTGTVTAGPVAVAGTGTVASSAINGSGAATTGAAQVSGAGTVIESGVNGTGAAALGAASITGSGDAPIAGTGAANSGAALASGDGALAASGSGLASLGPASADGSGTVTSSVVEGSGFVSTGPVEISGSGIVPIGGDGAAACAFFAVSGTGGTSIGIEGSGGLMLAPFVVIGLSRAVVPSKVIPWTRDTPESITSAVIEEIYG